VGAARATLTCEDSEWSRKFEEPGQEGWSIFFSKAASKGLPKPFNAAGWRCSQYFELWANPSVKLLKLGIQVINLSSSVNGDR
jgi:hypothetical protein